MQEGETEEDHAAHINRNVNQAQRQANEAVLMLDEAQLDSQGRPRQLQCNLNDEFVRVDGHNVYKDPKLQLGHGHQRARSAPADTGGR